MHTRDAPPSADEHVDRDKYMFHQANVIPTATPTGTKSLLEYWYEVVFAKLAEFINTNTFPITVRIDFRARRMLFSSDKSKKEASVIITAAVTTT